MNRYVLALSSSLAMGCAEPGEQAAPGASDLPEESATQESDIPPADSEPVSEVLVTPYTVEPMHRLTALEYQRSARDLLGIRPSRDDLPPDEVTFGFSNVDRGQVVSSLHVERWFNVAEDLGEQAMSTEPWSRVVRIADLGLPSARAYDVAWDQEVPWWLFTRASWQLTVRFDVPEAGNYDLAVEATWVNGWQGYDNGIPRMPYRILAQLPHQETLDLGLVDEAFSPSVNHASVYLEAGSHHVTLTLESPDGSEIAIGSISLTALNGARPPRQRVLDCDTLDLTCAREAIERIGARAWRRPLTAEESGRLHDLIDVAVDEGDPLEQGVSLALQAILMSPKFLFLVEPAGDHAPGVARPLTSHELAGRLAMLLWRSLPDENLAACADSGIATVDADPQDPCSLAGQLERMLADARSDAIGRDFGAQWMGADALQGLLRAGELFAERDDAVLHDMRLEVDALFETFAREAHPVNDLLRGGFRVVSPALATHYRVQSSEAAVHRVEGRRPQVRRRRPISRRTMLRGAGAMLGLPLLEAMYPTARAVDPIPQRLLVFFVPNGMYMPHFSPVNVGPNYTLSPNLSPLQHVRDDLLVVSGVSGLPTSGEPHASALGAMLTGRFIDAQPGLATPVTAETSMDQLVAAQIGTTTRLPSLELGSEGTFLCRFAGGSESYCPFLNGISWSSPTSPRTKEVSPRRAFERLFGDMTAASAEDRAKRLHYRQSVLDAVLADVADLERVLGAQDRARLDHYLTGVRDLEQRLERTEAELDPVCSAAAADVWTSITNDPSLDITQHVDLMVDLMVLALRCDATRVITYMLGNGRSERPYPFLGIEDSHHWISHHHQETTKINQLRTIAQWAMTRFGRLVAGLGEVTEADGARLLDHTAVMMLCGFGDSDEHDTDEIPLIFAGRGAGLATGQHILLTGNPQMSRVNLTLLQALGVPTSTFGGETETLPQLLA